MLNVGLQVTAWNTGLSCVCTVARNRRFDIDWKGRAVLQTPDRHQHGLDNKAPGNVPGLHKPLALISDRNTRCGSHPRVATFAVFGPSRPAIRRAQRKRAARKPPLSDRPGLGARAVRSCRFRSNDAD